MRIRNGVLVEVKGKETIRLETKEGSKLIRNVYLVPSLAQNLLSVGQMIENRYSLYFKGDTCTIYVMNEVIASIKMENKNFPIQWSYTKDIAIRTQLDES